MTGLDDVRVEFELPETPVFGIKGCNVYLAAGSSSVRLVIEGPVELVQLAARHHGLKPLFQDERGAHG